MHWYVSVEQRGELSIFHVMLELISRVVCPTGIAGTPPEWKEQIQQVSFLPTCALLEKACNDCSPNGL